MPNTSSAKKAARSSSKKQMHNLFWKGRIKRTEKSLKSSLDEKTSDVQVVSAKLSALQKVLDKAVKEKIISKNKANRLKSKYAQKISAKDIGDSSKKSPAKARSKSKQS